MHILAALFDIGDDGFDIYDASLVIGLVASLYLAVRWVGRKFDARMTLIATQLDERTEQIQPETNHGKSLSDLHKKVDGIVEENQTMRREFTAFILAVGMGAKLPPDERVPFWDSVVDAYKKGYLSFRFPATPDKKE